MASSFAEGFRQSASCRIVVCGAKGSGKSSFVKFFCNHFLTSQVGSCGVGFLDLDPGQPEYSPPGDVSLIHLRSLNLGPSFSHPDVYETHGDKVLRRHHFGVLSPKEYTETYIDSLQDMLDRYRRELECLGCPLILNCCGWTKGSGLEIMLTIIERSQPTDVVLMELETGGDVAETLQAAAKGIDARFHTLSSGKPQNTNVARTAAQLREMLLCSYLHMRGSELDVPRWDARPLSRQTNLSLSFSGPEQRIRAILVLGEDANYDLIENLIEGTVMSLVVLEDEFGILNSVDAWSSANPEMNASGGFARNSVEETLVSNEGVNAWDAFSKRRSRGKYRVLRNKYDLPYLSTGTGANPPLDPFNTCSLGQVLLKAVNKAERNFEVVTNLACRATIAQSVVLRKPLILVSGKTGVPDWVYKEEQFEDKDLQWRIKREGMLAKSSSLQHEESRSESSVDSDLETSQAEMTRIGSGRKRGKTRNHGRAWRVRRNLMSHSIQNASNPD